MAKSDKSSLSPSDSIAIACFLLGAITLMSPHREITVILCSLMIWGALCWLIYQYRWDALLTNTKAKLIAVSCALAFSVFLGFNSWPRRERPDVVLKIEPVSLPIRRETEYINSMDIMGRFAVVAVGKGYGPANKRDEFWPSKDIEYPSPAFRYTLINRGNKVLYNLTLPLEIKHDEAVANQNGFSQGNQVHHISSAVKIDELIPYGLTAHDSNFVFYVRNLSEDFVYVIPDDYVMIGHGQKVEIRTFGPILPLEPPKVYEKK